MASLLPVSGKQITFGYKDALAMENFVDEGMVTVFCVLQMLLLVGTKLQGIITKMCLDSHEKSHIARGTVLVKPSDHFFWFGRPKLLLHLIHFILFQAIPSMPLKLCHQQDRFSSLFQTRLQGF